MDARIKSGHDVFLCFQSGYIAISANKSPRDMGRAWRPAPNAPFSAASSSRGVIAQKT